MACKVKPEEILSNLKSWSMTQDGREAIKKEFKFKNFNMAFSFMTAIALLSL